MDKAQLLNRLLFDKFKTESSLTLLQKFYTGNDAELLRQIDQGLDRLHKINRLIARLREEGY
jgi:hypothetical protein